MLPYFLVTGKTEVNGIGFRDEQTAGYWAESGYHAKEQFLDGFPEYKFQVTAEPVPYYVMTPGVSHLLKKLAAVLNEDRGNDDLYDAAWRLCEEAGLLTITCKFCGQPAQAQSAHIHQGDWVGDECCWDDRLATTE